MCTPAEAFPSKTSVEDRTERATHGPYTPEDLIAKRCLRTGGKFTKFPGNTGNYVRERETGSAVSYNSRVMRAAGKNRLKIRRRHLTRRNADGAR